MAEKQKRCLVKVGKQRGCTEAKEKHFDQQQYWVDSRGNARVFLRSGRITTAVRHDRDTCLLPWNLSLLGKDEMLLKRTDEDRDKGGL